MTLDLTPHQRASFIRWTQDDYLQLLCAAEPLLATGMDLVDALVEVQDRFLVPHKQQPSRYDLEKKATSKVMPLAMAQFKRLDAASRAEQAEALKRERLLHDLAHPTKVYWRDVEWALVWRRAMYWKRDLGDKRSYPEMAIHAQMIELPVDRWRKRTVLQASYGPNLMHGVEAQFKRIAPLADELLKGIPFEPGKKQTLMLPEPERPQPTAIDQGVPIAGERYFDDTPANDPADPPPKSLQQLAQEGRAQKAQEPAEPRPATLASPTPEKSPRDPIRAFAEHFATGLSDLMDAVATHTVATLETRLRRMSEQLVSQVAEDLDRRNEQRIKAMVESALESALGGKPQAPDVTLPTYAPEMTGTGLEGAVKIDILGLHGQQIVEVKRALNGYADSVRFVAPDKIDAWTPRDVVLINARMGLGAAERKAQGHKSHIHRYWGTASSALKIIEEVYTQQGLVPPTQHH